MNIHAEIKKLYLPMQPSLKHLDGNIVYTELLPDKKLQDFIYCYWQLKTKQPLTEKLNYLIVADGCIDIFFELHNSKDSYVMGFCKKYTEFTLDKSFNYVGVRFLPTMFSQLFTINSEELSNKFEHLSNVVPETSIFIENKFSPEINRDSIKKIFDIYFIQLVSKLTFNWDKRLYESIQIILKNYGTVNVEKDLNTGISSRQLRRLFDFYIGDTAKTFSKVVRFQNALSTMPLIQSLKKNKFFYDVGYYDQAHFIKDFKRFYGVTPYKALDR